MQFHCSSLYFTLIPLISFRFQCSSIKRMPYCCVCVHKPVIISVSMTQMYSAHNVSSATMETVWKSMFFMDLVVVRKKRTNFPFSLVQMCTVRTHKKRDMQLMQVYEEVHKVNKNECNSRNFYRAACDEHCNNAIENNTIEYVNCENCLAYLRKHGREEEKLYIQQMHTHTCTNEHGSCQ